MGGYNSGLTAFTTMINLLVIVSGGLMITKDMISVTDLVTFLLDVYKRQIKMKTHPAISTAANIANIKRQINEIASLYDWDMEVNTTDPKFYKWTQWIFVQMFKKGLAYEKEMPINWCPSCKTGLANEEVVNGCCERLSLIHIYIMKRK